MNISPSLDRDEAFAALSVLTDAARAKRAEILALEADGQHGRADAERAAAQPLLGALCKLTEASAAARRRRAAAPVSPFTAAMAAALGRVELSAPAHPPCADRYP